MSQTRRKKREDIRGQGHAPGGGGLPHPLDTGGHEVGQGGGHTPSPGVEGDPKVQDGDDLIPARGVEGQGAHPKLETKRKKIKKRNVPKLHQKATAQPDALGVQAEREGGGEAGVVQDLLKSPDLLKESCPAHHLHGDIKKRRRKIKTKKEAEMKGNDQQVKRRGAKTRRRSEKGSLRVTKTSNR